jgi:hypothetical protein
MKNKNNNGNVQPPTFPQMGPFGGFGNMGNFGGTQIPQMLNQNPNQNQPNMGTMPFMNPFFMGMRNPFFLQQNQQLQNSNNGEIPI